MIRVEPAPEPPTFDERVRQPGRRFLAEKRGDLPAHSFPPYWRRAHDDLLSAYHRICAYVCIYIEPVTGQPTVDHMIPKSLALDRVYEWSNYRLACSLMNSRKGAVTNVLDPFEIEDGWFVLELVGFQILPSAGLDAAIHRQAQDTIRVLRLDDQECRALRERYAVDYWAGDISLRRLRERAPFVARELACQGRLLAKDQ